MAAALGSASTRVARARALAHACRDVGRCTTASTRSACSTARLPHAGAGVGRCEPRRWRGCARARRARGTQVHPADLDDALCTSGRHAPRAAAAGRDAAAVCGGRRAAAGRAGRAVGGARACASAARTRAAHRLLADLLARRVCSCRLWRSKGAEAVSVRLGAAASGRRKRSSTASSRARCVRRRRRSAICTRPSGAQIEVARWRRRARCLSSATTRRGCERRSRRACRTRSLAAALRNGEWAAIAVAVATQRGCARALAPLCARGGARARADAGDHWRRAGANVWLLTAAPPRARGVARGARGAWHARRGRRRRCRSCASMRGGRDDGAHIRPCRSPSPRRCCTSASPARRASRRRPALLGRPRAAALPRARRDQQPLSRAAACAPAAWRR